MISSALVLAWIMKLCPHTAHALPLAEGITQAANEDQDPLDAAATLTAIAYYESRFDMYALSKRDDPAHAIGAFQLHVRWLLFPASPYEQAATALWLVRESQVRCGTLAEYTSGQCGAGTEEAALREKLAARLKFRTYVEVRG